MMFDGGGFGKRLERHSFIIMGTKKDERATDKRQKVEIHQ